MIARNFKVRIHNLTLKKTVFLENSQSAFALRIKYTKYLASLGYIYYRNSNITGDLRTYSFYSEKMFPTRALFNDACAKYFLTRSNKWHGSEDVKTKMEYNPYLVWVEIIRMNHRHVSKSAKFAR